MNGPEHYREAEALAESALNWMSEWGPADMTPTERLARKNSDVAMAQVHATLAHAAATALNDGSDGLAFSDWDAWREAAGARVAPEVPA